MKRIIVLLSLLVMAINAYAFDSIMKIGIDSGIYYEPVYAIGSEKAIIDKRNTTKVKLGIGLSLFDDIVDFYAGIESYQDLKLDVGGFNAYSINNYLNLVINIPHVDGLKIVGNYYCQHPEQPWDIKNDVFNTCECTIGIEYRKMFDLF